MTETGRGIERRDPVLSQGGRHMTDRTPETLDNLETAGEPLQAIRRTTTDSDNARAANAGIAVIRRYMPNDEPARSSLNLLSPDSGDELTSCLAARARKHVDERVARHRRKEGGECRRRLNLSLVGILAIHCGDDLACEMAD